MNTLEIVKILEEQGFKKEASINLAEAINGRSGLATKEDIGVLKEDIAEVRVELKQDIAELKTSNKWMVAILTVILAGLVGLYLKG